MFCSQCGARVAQSARFCEECGAGIGSQGSTALTGRVGGVVAEALPPMWPAAQMAGAPSGTPMIQFNPTINVSVPGYQPPVGPLFVATGRSDVPIALRALWFLFIGLWLGVLWTSIAWVLNATIVGLPLGLAMINRLPQVMTLKSSVKRTVVMTNGYGTFIAQQSAPRQLPFLVRAVYFLAVGIWMSLIWMILAWVAAALIVSLPLSFWMFNRVLAVTTLRLE